MTGHKPDRHTILKAVWRLLGEPDVQFGLGERPGLGRCGQRVRLCRLNGRRAKFLNRIGKANTVVAFRIASPCHAVLIIAPPERPGALPIVHFRTLRGFWRITGRQSGWSWFLRRDSIKCIDAIRYDRRLTVSVEHGVNEFGRSIVTVGQAEPLALVWHAGRTEDLRHHMARLFASPDDAEAAAVDTLARVERMKRHDVERALG